MNKQANPHEAALKTLLNQMVDMKEIKKMIVNDNEVVEEFFTLIVERMINRGLIPDKILSVTETMQLLQIQSRPTLRKLSKEGKLKPVYLKQNGQPKYRLSDINLYIKQLGEVTTTQRKKGFAHVNV